jgi:hypothetical protein
MVGLLILLLFDPGQHLLDEAAAEEDEADDLFKLPH